MKMVNISLVNESALAQRFTFVLRSLFFVLCSLYNIIQIAFYEFGKPDQIGYCLWAIRLRPYFADT